MLAAAPMAAALPRRTSPALTIRPPEKVLAPERTRAPGPVLTKGAVPEMTPPRVRTPVPYWWTESWVAVVVRLELMVSLEVTVLSTSRPPEVRVTRNVPETVLAVVPVRRMALAATAPVKVVAAAETE